MRVMEMKRPPQVSHKHSEDEKLKPVEEEKKE